MALYLVLHHPRDPRPSRWANAWEPGSPSRVRAITTTAKIAHDVEEEGAAYLHRCAFERDPAAIVAEVRFDSAVAINPGRKGSDYLVQFTTIRTMNAGSAAVAGPRNQQLRRRSARRRPSPRSSPVSSPIPDPRTCIVALGGGAGNALNQILATAVPGVTTLAANTDAQDLKRSRAGTTVLLGREVTKGLGANSDPEVGAHAAIATADELRGGMLGARLVIVLGSLGGGTGSGAAPVVVELARAAGAVVVPIVTLPFAFEGRRRRRQADEAFAALAAANDGLVAVAHGGVWLDLGKRMMTEAFHEMDEAVECAVHALLARIAATDGTAELEAVAKEWVGTWTPRTSIGTAPEQK